MPSRPAIRDARDADCRALTELCHRSKAVWGYDAEFMRLSRDVLTVTPARLREWTVRVAESPEGTLLGVAAVSVEFEARRSQQEAELELLFVDPAAMRQGVGRELIADLRSHPALRKAALLWILSDPDAEPFYQSVGAVRVGQRPSDAIPGRRLPWLRLFLGGSIPSIETERLLLRPWREADLEPFARINADAEVVRLLPSVLTRDESDALALRIRHGFDQCGFGLWAAERRDLTARPFIGFIGVMMPGFSASFTPCVEIGWRLAPEHWGLGLATEGARAVARHAFAALELDELVSFTVANNIASRRVMEKLGMQRNAREDFDHPRLPQGHPLRRHVLYRLAAPRD